MSAKKTSHKTPLILNVDVDDATRCFKTRTLERAGFHVIEAASNAQALQQVRRHAPDLVLLEAPSHADGSGACRRIRQADASGSILVLQTLPPQAGDGVEDAAEGADNFLVAPLDPGELIANVRALLRLGRVQGELRDSEARFRYLSDHLTDVFWVFNPREEGLWYVSPAYENLWGRSVYELDLNGMSWLEAVHPDERERVAGAFAALAENPHYEQEFRVVRTDGAIRWIRDRVFPVGDDRVVRISQDISTRKESERHKDAFLAMLAHELRNPLGPMRNAVELLRLSEGEAVGGLHIDAREILGRHIDHLVALVDGLLDVARMTQGRLRLQRAPVELKTFVNAALESTRPFLIDRRHQLQLQLPGEEVWIYGDGVRLSQVIANLLHNAGQYTDRGGVVTLRVDVEAACLRIVVEDTGIGIPAAQLPLIFDWFAQAERCADRAPEGLGVGLSLVRQLVELHGGRIEAFSAGVGLGSRFTVELPLARARRAPVRAVSRPAHRTPSRELRILLVDDSVDAVQLMKVLLQRFGYDIETAHNGPDALKTAQSFQPDVALLDIGLPGMDGYALARALRRMPALKQITLVALTGYGQERDRERALAAGFSQHFVKPLDFEQLRTLLDAAAKRLAG